MFETLENIDRTILLAINGANHPVLDSIFWQASAGWIFIPLWLFILWYFYKQKGIKFVGTAVLCVAFIILFCDRSTELAKHSVERYRPTHNLEIKDKIHLVNHYRGGQFGFFSGHSSNNTGVALFLFLLLGRLNSRYRYFIFLVRLQLNIAGCIWGCIIPVIFSSALWMVFYGDLFFIKYLNI